jgi:hypothetical protein
MPMKTPGATTTLALHSADPGTHFRVISAGAKADGMQGGLLGRSEFDQVQGLSLPGP